MPNVIFKLRKYGRTLMRSLCLCYGAGWPCSPARRSWDRAERLETEEKMVWKHAEPFPSRPDCGACGSACKIMVGTSQALRSSCRGRGVQKPGSRAAAASRSLGGLRPTAASWAPHVRPGLARAGGGRSREVARYRAQMDRVKSKAISAKQKNAL